MILSLVSRTYEKNAVMEDNVISEKKKCYEIFKELINRGK